MNNTYEPVIGLEIHVELKTKSGMFCGCPADHFAKKPNTQTCPVCLGLPGALPVPNKKAVEWTIMLGLALGSEIAEVSKFDRKHYFYPDLPKGYQISQYDQPLCTGGLIVLDPGNQSIKPYQVRIRRVHLEEDTGKLQHAIINGQKVTLVDFNRSGVPLVEIVTEADIRSSEQAKEFLKKLHQIVRYMGISNADMEKGSMRLEPNISLRKVGETSLPPYKVEIKNINSFRFAVAAIEYEITRQAAILDSRKIPVQETRGWDNAKKATVSQRVKEGAADYRYFPEPDIPPMRFTKSYIETIRKGIPELPEEKKQRFMSAYALVDIDAMHLIDTRALADYFEEAVKASNALEKSYTPKEVANWLINKKPDIETVMPAKLIEDMYEAKAVVAVSEDELRATITSILEANTKAVADYKAGKQQSIMFLMGLVRRQFPKADTRIILDALKRVLET